MMRVGRDLAAAVGMALALAGASAHGQNPPAQAPPQARIDGPVVRWQFSVSGRVRPYTRGIEYIAQQVSDRTGGKFTIVIGYRGRFSPERENLEAIRLGVLDGAAACIYASPDRTPAATALDLPFLPIGDFDQARAVHEAFFRHPYLIGELARWNARFLMAGIIPQHEVMGSGQPPRTLEEWKGKRVRASGNIGRGLEALGVSIIDGKLGTASADIAAGRLDGIALPFSYGHIGYAIPAVGKWYTVNLSPGTINCPYVISTNSWAKLPAAYRELLDQTIAGAYAAMRQAYDAYDAQAQELFKKNDIAAVRYSEQELARIREVAAKPYWNAWLKEMKGRGVPGQDLLDLILATAAKTRTN